jgi:hypothetical protein
MAKGASFRRFIIVDDSTISETRDRQEEKRPRKRVRVDSDDEEPSSKNGNLNHVGNSWSSLTPSDKPGERDALYYLDDPTATCIFRAGDVLFKVSFFFLSGYVKKMTGVQYESDSSGNIRVLSVYERSVTRSPQDEPFHK